MPGDQCLEEEEKICLKNENHLELRFGSRVTNLWLADTRNHLIEATPIVLHLKINNRGLSRALELKRGKGGLAKAAVGCCRRYSAPDVKPRCFIAPRGK
jgi:hypothetical protein